MSSRQLDEEAIFHVARRINDDSARTDYLEQVCAGDQALRERVEALLQIHEQEQSFLKSKNKDGAPTIDAVPLSERPGVTIGRYKLMEQIGEGGMGVVFVAQQEKPLRRKVALKVIKPGMDSKAVIARFEAERQALALMNHPNIAKVFDAGTTSSGRPYFVMELVSGVPITEFCDQHKLTIHERLEIFTHVCHAIQHAHQKAIIHRDIKATNVLVTEQDGKAVPKVIDFGVAKALNQSLADQTVYTSFQTFVGTPLYASPEQASLSNVDVDTRSDVYSLGVLFYELVTSTTPFDNKQFENAAYDEICRIIREFEPAKPSTRISSLANTASGVAQARGTAVEKLGNLVRGDLDWIAMKALEKDRTRRYDTPSVFAADIQRFLRNEAIEARPPSKAYRLRKLASHYRAVLATTAIVVLTLLAATVTTSWQAVRARKAEEEMSATLTRLHDELMDKATLAVLSGNATEARQAINDATAAGMNELWEHILLGQLELYSGDFDAGIKHLTRATELDGKSVAAWAMLAVAYDLSGQSEKHISIVSQLPTATDCPSNDLPFLINAQLHRDTNQAYEALRLLTPDQDSALTRLIRADVEIHRVIETGDIEVAESALHNLEVAKILMKGRRNEYTLGLDLVAHLAAISVTDDPDQARSLSAEAAILASGLSENPRTSLSRTIIAMYFRYCERDLTKAFDILEHAVKEGATDYALTEYASMLYKRGDYALAGNILDDSISPANTPVAVALAGILAWSPTSGDEQLKRLYEQTRAANRKYCFWSPETILIFVRDQSYVEEKCRLLLDDLADRPNAAWNQSVVRFIAWQSNAADLIQQAGSSRVRQCTAHYLIAMRHMRKGDSYQATQQLHACLDKASFLYARGWAEALLERIKKDPSWLMVKASQEEL